MKNQLLSVALLLGLSGFSFAGTSWNPGTKRKPFEDLRKPFVLKISPFHFFDRQLSLPMEFFNASYKRSTVATINLIYADNTNIYDVGASLHGERRFYPRGFMPDTTTFKRNSASGFYFGLGMQAGYSKYNDRQMNMNNYVTEPNCPTCNGQTINYNVSITSTWISPTVTVGYQFILWDALYLDAYVGGGVRINDSRKSSSDPKANLSNFYQDSNPTIRYYKGVVPRFGLSLGVAL